MNHPTLPKPGLSRRSVLGRAVVVGAALSLGSRLGHAFADDATPSTGPVEFLWETRGDPDSPLGNPAHLAIAPDGSIWVADGDNHRFQLFAPDGSLLEVWGTKGSGEGEFDFSTPYWYGYEYGAVAFAPDGTFYVADPGNHRIQRFGPDRAFLTAWGSEGTEPGQFITAMDLVVDGQGRVYVADADRDIFDPESGAIQVFDADGRYLAEWGVSGREPGQMDTPFGIGLDPDGTLLVAEFDGSRVQRFTTEGELLDGWGGPGTADGQFVWAMDAAVDSQGRVFVPDYSNGRVQVFDREGRFLAAWGKLGSDPGEFLSALGVAVGGDDTVYVSDAGKRLQAFRVGDLPVADPATPAASAPEGTGDAWFEIAFPAPLLPAGPVYAWSTLYAVDPGVSVAYPGFAIEVPVAALVWVQSGTMAIDGEYVAVHRAADASETSPQPGELLLGAGDAAGLELGPDRSYALRSAGSEPLVFAEFWLVGGPGPAYSYPPGYEILSYYHLPDAAVLTSPATVTMRLTQSVLAPKETLAPAESDWQLALDASPSGSVSRVVLSGALKNWSQTPISVVAMTADFREVAD